MKLWALALSCAKDIAKCSVRNETIPPLRKIHVFTSHYIDEKKNKIKEKQWSIFIIILILIWIPREQGSAVASVFSGTASFHMSLPIGVYVVFLRTTFALPLFLIVFSAEVLLDAGEVAERPCGVVVDAGRFGTHVSFLPWLFAPSLPQLPRQVVAAPVKL